MRLSVAAAAALVAATCFCFKVEIRAEDLTVVSVDGQPVAANIRRLVEALELLGAPLDRGLVGRIDAAANTRDAGELQRILDPNVLFAVSINPESRVKVMRGPGRANLQQAGYTPCLVKIFNESTVTKRLRIVSPQSGPVYAGVAELSMQRQQQEVLRVDQNVRRNPDRFLHVEMYSAPPMTDQLSGLAVEYAMALIYSSEAGKREATIGFDVGQGNQDLGFRGEVPILFDIQPAIPVQLAVRDADGQPTVAKLQFRDVLGHVYPPQPKRLAPDFFFQPHIYRGDGETVLLPPGKFSMIYGRGPEYRELPREVTVRPESPTLRIDLQRWVNPQAFGFYSGDHHIHAAGCAHYTSPTEGVLPADMFRQVKGEALNVGCVLTWGPCFDYQRQFFAPRVDNLSEPLTVLKYDLEISGFGSQALGHVCLLHLNNQTYPGSNGTATQGWPTWTTPVMRWTKEQGGYAGYAHSASGLRIDPPAASRRLLAQFDGNRNRRLSMSEAKNALLPQPFAAMDDDGDGELSERELTLAHDLAADQLPNLAIPEMNGVGAMEICVSTSEGVCDFISAMDTSRIQEWNTWYHILNCGFPLKVSGETDFPCMSSRQVGQGRVYVQLGNVERVDFGSWCAGLAAGRSYVSDGYAHALDFQVQGIRPGTGDVTWEKPATATVTAKVAFALEQPMAVAHGGVTPAAGQRDIGDTVVLHQPRRDDMQPIQQGGERLVEIVVNGKAIASQAVPADGQVHELKFEIPIQHSSWVALRHFPQLHTNPVNVLVGGRPIRASRDSARWCVAMTEQLWTNRERAIAPAERVEAKRTFDRALTRFRQIADEAN